MKLLFLMTRPIYARNFEATLGLLAERGHRIHVGFEHEHGRLPDQWSLLDRLAAEHPGFTYGRAPVRSASEWAPFARGVRLSLDYLFYLDPRFHDAPTVRAHVRVRVPALTRVLADRLAGAPVGRRALVAALRVLERILPPSRDIEAFLRAEGPDVLGVTPVAQFGTPQADYLAGARRLRIPTAGCIYSWDNLTSGGWIREAPDRIVVWNETQRREAVELHGLPTERVAVTGASAWDHWFTWRPSRSRGELCAEVGLPMERPYVLFLGSSGFAGPEAEFVAEFLRRARAEGAGALRDTSVLVRPHPQRFDEQWEDLLTLGHEGFAVWPRQGRDPSGPSARADYFDSMYHAAAVFGINTSAFIESAIVGRVSHAVRLPELRRAQDEMVHFRYLPRENGGPLRMAASWEELMADVAASVADPDRDEEELIRFVRTFVRPAGIDVPAAPAVAGALEELAAHTARLPVVDPVWAPVPRALLTPLVLGWVALPSRRQARRRVARVGRRLRRLARTAVRRARRLPGRALQEATGRGRRRS